MYRQYSSTTIKNRIAERKAFGARHSDGFLTRAYLRQFLYLRCTQLHPFLQIYFCTRNPLLRQTSYFIYENNFTLATASNTPQYFPLPEITPVQILSRCNPNVLYPTTPSIPLTVRYRHCSRIPPPQNGGR